MKTLLILSLALAGVLLAPAYAATLYSTVEVYTQVDNPYSHSVVNCTQTTASPAGNAPATCDGTALTSSQGAGREWAVANTEFGALHASAEVQTKNGPYPQDAGYAQASAVFTDGFRIKERNCNLIAGTVHSAAESTDR